VFWFAFSKGSRSGRPQWWTPLDHLGDVRPSLGAAYRPSLLRRAEGPVHHVRGRESSADRRFDLSTVLVRDTLGDSSPCDGERRCPECRLFNRNLGLGAPCPECDHPIVLSELVPVEARSGRPQRLRGLGTGFAVGVLRKNDQERFECRWTASPSAA
jgi:hypothetical protein